jgi:uncharacterized membrane protein
MRIKYIGLAVGLLVGIVWMWLGLEKLAVVLVCGAIGYVIGRILEGELDVQRFIDDLRRR